METITLSIPNMKSPHCMMVVSGALKNVQGAAIKKLASGSAEIELSGATKALIVETIEKAGYSVANK
jgi:copper chaperone CopZ